MRGFFFILFWFGSVSVLAQIPQINWADNFSKIMTVLTPLIIAIIGYFQIRSSRRADAAATLAAAKAVEVKEAAQEVKAELKASTAETKFIMEGQSNQLTVIHALNNSALTAAMESDLGSKMLNVTFMEEIIHGLGRAPSVKTTENLIKAKGQVEELQKAIAERKRQQEVINQKIVEGQKSGPIQVLVGNTEAEAIPMKPVQ